MNTVRAIRTLSIAIVAMSAMAFPGTAIADIYQCVLLTGETEYQAKPCPEGALEKILDDRETRKARAEAEDRSKQFQTSNEEFSLNQEERITRWRRESSPRDLQVRDERIEQAATVTKADASCDLSWARSIRAYAAQLATIEEFGEQTVYSFHRQWWSDIRPQLHQLIRAASNADSCLTGRARRINFYAPGGKPVGFSDPRQGISLFN
jgi:hypothetical protein